MDEFDITSEYKQLPCYGKLIQGQEEYWLLAPHPVTGDSWMRDERMFLVTTRNPKDTYTTENEGWIDLYPAEFHVVVNGTYLIKLCPPTKGYLWVERKDVWFEEPFELDIDKLQVPPFPDLTDNDLEKIEKVLHPELVE